ncbi:hypothetical protein Tco_0705543 [Tanacetum coccineum]|uniref:C2 NT-type domain-containing protein n=1 Tax=Tanacetum coccineum TaxID=301880 RepID=A0ABQ4Y6X7_9ASTR
MFADISLHVSLDEIKVDKTLRFVEEPIENSDREVKCLKCSRMVVVKVHLGLKRGKVVSSKYLARVSWNSMFNFELTWLNLGMRFPKGGDTMTTMTWAGESARVTPMGGLWRVDETQLIEPVKTVRPKKTPKSRRNGSQDSQSQGNVSPTQELPTENNGLKTVKDGAGGFFAWPKNQVILDEEVTPPTTIQKISDYYSDQNTIEAQSYVP